MTRLRTASIRWTLTYLSLSNPMTAILANNDGSSVVRLSEDHDSTPVATWVERYKGRQWDWQSMTTQPFAEIVKEYNEKGFVCLAIED